MVGLLYYGAHTVWPTRASASSPPLWPGWDHARGVATRSDGEGGYILDGFGGLHPFALAGAAPPAVTVTETWAGWDIARGIALRSDGHSGYVLDGRGGLHPFGVAGDMPPGVTLTGHWTWDFARSVVLRADGLSGYVLDGWGALHPFGVAGDIPAAPKVTAYWTGWDFARSVAMVPGADSGYVLGEYGLTHPFNPGTRAPALPAVGYTPGHDQGRGVAVDSAGTVYVVSDAGYLVQLASSAHPTTRWLAAPVHARGIAFGSAHGAGGVIVDAFGAVTSVDGLAVIQGPTPSSAPTPSTALKPHLTGFLDRSGVPAYPWMTGYVVNVNWADLQPVAGGPIVSGNPVDSAIAQAQATGLGLKLRVFAGDHAPDWAKNIGGAPFTMTDPHSGASGTVGRFWLPAFGAAFADFQAKLAAKYDAVPEVREVTIGRCSTIYSEPFLRNASAPANVAALLGAGYTVAQDHLCQSQAIDAMQPWQLTHSDLSFNPYQSIDATGKVTTDEAFTESMMGYCRSSLGARCVLENNSLRAGGSGAVYDQMYAAMRTAGAPLTFQTATAARMGDPATTFGLAVGYGANSVELPNGYTAFPASVLSTAEALLVANP